MKGNWKKFEIFHDSCPVQCTELQDGRAWFDPRASQSRRDESASPDFANDFLLPSRLTALGLRGWVMQNTRLSSGPPASNHQNHQKATKMSQLGLQLQE